MFKTLIATCLLTFSCSSGSLKRTNVNRANEKIYSLHGAYVLRDSFEQHYHDFIYKYGNGTYTFSQEFATIENNYYKCLFYYNNNYYYGSFDSFTLEVGVYNNSELDVNVDMDMDDNGTSVYIQVPDVDMYDVLTLEDWLTYSTNTNSVKYHILYINNYLRVNEQDFDIFNIFYTGLGNEYNTFYDGYYTFVNNWSNSFYWNAQITTICDNQMHDLLGREGDGNGLKAYSTYFEGNNYDTIIYEGGSNNTGGYYKIKDRTIYLSGMLPNWLYDKFDTAGTFGYIPKPVESYTFSEFFFSVMDAPIYYLWSLFNFELFGMNLFIALTSMITLCIVIIVIRKIL